jgi:hypothetical protein
MKVKMNNREANKKDFITMKNKTLREKLMATLLQMSPAVVLLTLVMGQLL